MRFSLADLVLFASVLATVLSGGVFFAWAVTVVPGLSKLSDAGYLSAMQSMNRAIQNPIFLSCFFGAAILLPIASWQQFGNASFWYITTACAVYVLGVIGVTVFCNVPLNEMLDKSNLAAAGLSELRKAFEPKWNAWNAVRAVSSLAAIALGLIALLKQQS